MKSGPARRVHRYQLLVCHDSAAVQTLEPPDWFPKALETCGGTVDHNYPQGRHGVNAVAVSFRGTLARKKFVRLAAEEGRFLCIPFGPRAR